ncbi:MAG: patatin-like phospholipase family protein [Pseudomonadota bacterium]
MQSHTLRKSHHGADRSKFECVALLLQGGGALGAYQAGVYDAMAEADLHPDWVAGISIGAMNAAIIAGNAPEDRIPKLRGFWDRITTKIRFGQHIKQDGSVPDLPWLQMLMPQGDAARRWFNMMSSSISLFHGQDGFFEPRSVWPWFAQAGSPGATSYYDTSLLKATLEEFVDFERVNSGDMRLSVGAVNVRTGNFAYFDTRTHQIRPEHIMASGALPPGFPAVPIDGQLYWDGGLVSNTPLEWVLSNEPVQDTLAFQIDLWSAVGQFPRDMADVMEREKDIRYSSRTRLNTSRFRERQSLRHAVASLLDKLPPELQDEEECKLLRPYVSSRVLSIVHLIYRTKNYESQSKDYDFSRTAMEEHWQSGKESAMRTLRHETIFDPPTNIEGLKVFDLARDGGD